MSQKVYQQYLQSYSELLKKARKRDIGLSAIRFTLIALAAMLAYLYLDFDQSGFLYAIVVMLAGFVWVLLRHIKLREYIRDLKNYILINERELNYLQGDLSPFGNGEKWISRDHLFAYDLDLFGHHSLFQHINRTVSNKGEEILAQSILNDSRGNIGAEQKAVLELAGQTEWRQDFSVKGMVVEEEPNLNFMLEKWQKLQSKSFLITRSWLLYSLLAISSILLLNWLVAPSLQTFTWFSYAFMFNLMLVFSKFRDIKSEYELVGKIAPSLEMYSKLLQQIEGSEFSSEKLNELQSRLKVENHTASSALYKLSRHLDALDQMNNVVALIFTNGLYHNHLHVYRRLRKWKERHSKSIAPWLEVVAEFDALCSKANFVFNHPDFCVPKISSQPGFEGVGMGHPLISANKRVSNDINFRYSKYVILTGSNMSGKSTFLRTLGVNLVLMKMGMTVCAKSFSSFPFTLLTSMKLADSLEKEESYFQAEVIRLRRIKDVLESGQPCLVLLDEILRGTNSDDKKHGTRLFMEQLIPYDAMGIIATHDIDIAELAEDHPDVFSAMYFESRLNGKDLLFDYKLRPGVCTTPNATELMRRQGII